MRAQIKTFAFPANQLERSIDELVNEWLDKQPKDSVMFDLKIGGSGGWVFYVLEMGYPDVKSDLK